jgi:hypothetical protein
MSEAKLQAARELIEEGHYAEARTLLLMIADPEARAMLADLNTLEQINAKMQVALDLMEKKDYDTAREILVTVHHPTVAMWLQRLTTLKATEERSTRFTPAEGQARKRLFNRPPRDN